MLKKYWWRYQQRREVNLPPVPVRMPDATVEQRKAVDLPSRFDLQLQSWDMAFKDTGKSDFVVGQVPVACGADRYILDRVRDRMDLPATVLAVRRLSARWPEALLKLVDDKANGPAVIQSLRHEIAGLVEVNPQGGKISRAAGPAAAGVGKLVSAPSDAGAVGRGVSRRVLCLSSGITTTRWTPGARAPSGFLR